jgi:hypothetical protein
MTLEKHQIQGIPQFKCKVVDSSQFEEMMQKAGYLMVGSAPAQGNRIKVWWTHTEYQRVESIYTQDRTKVITAYHVA